MKLNVLLHIAGAQWLSGRVLEVGPRGCGFEPRRGHCIVSLSKNINPSLVLVQPRKIRPFITERLLMGCKESNQTNKNNYTWDKLHYQMFCLIYISALCGFVQHSSAGQISSDGRWNHARPRPNTVRHSFQNIKSHTDQNDPGHHHIIWSTEFQ